MLIFCKQFVDVLAHILYKTIPVSQLIAIQYNNIDQITSFVM